MPENLLHYLDDSDRNAVIYHNKSNGTEKLTALLKESLQIRDLLQDEEWHDFDQYKNLIRCIDDQCTVNEEGEPIPKNSHTIKGKSLQSPRESDATARTKNKKTYVGESANVCETYNDEGDSQITEADLQPNVHSDTDFFKEYIEEKPDPDSDAIEEQCTTDAGYCTMENVDLAVQKGVMLVPTALTSSNTNPLYSGFALSEDGKRPIKCPNDCIPGRQK